jgi:hypothetical protein
MASGPSSQLPPELISLLGDHVILLHTPSSDGSGIGLDGQTVDCAVLGLDLRWPLRLGHGWRLCQCLHHDLKRWCWVIEGQGRVIRLTTIDDPMGLGRDGFPTGLLARAPSGAPDEVLAAYLAAKRLRSGMLASPEWARIGRLARANPDGFVDAFAAVVGQRAAELILESSLQGQPPRPTIWRRARRQQRLRRFRTPARALAVLTIGARRHLDRIAHPTGLLVLLVGADGSGKSTLARSLPELCDGFFRRAPWYQQHPDVPPPGAGLPGSGQPDPTHPLDRPSHGRVASLLLVGRYWLDTALGGWMRAWPFRMRNGLLVNESRWWNLALDPRRHRLAVPSRLIRALGALLPRPDLALILNSSPTILPGGDAETSGKEPCGQSWARRSGLGRGIRSTHLDASGPLQPVEENAREVVLDLLESRATARLSPGWSALPRRRSGRWLLPRGPRTMARAGLGIYQPVTTRALLGWQAARLLAACGAFQLLPRGEAPPREVRTALAPYVPRGGTLAVARTNHPGRYVALLLDGAAKCHGVAKVATDPQDERTLDREASGIVQVGALLTPPVFHPSVLAHDPGLLILEPMAWRPRLRSWRLDEDVAHVLGVLFRTGARGEAGGLGAAHGDSAPWNLLRTERGWVLLDWEDASFSKPAFFDVFHYIIQAHTHLGRPSSRVVLDGVLEGRGWVGRAVRAYADGAGLAVGDAPRWLATYLRTVESRFLPVRAGEKSGNRERERLLARLEG